MLFDLAVKSSSFVLCFFTGEHMHELKNEFNEKWEKPEHVSRSHLSVLQGCCSLKQTTAEGGLLDKMYS